MSEWISIKDRLPEEGKNVILFDSEQVFCGRLSEGSWNNQGCDGICYGWYEKKPITHWYPLPEPPKKKEPHSCSLKCVTNEAGTLSLIKTYQTISSIHEVDYCPICGEKS